MAVIGRIRKYSGLLIAIIGIALAGFVLQDFFKKSGSGRGAKEFGEVGGEKISYRDFDAKVEEQVEQIKKQSEGQPVNSDKVNQIRQQVWNQMVRDIIMTKQLDELGITVSTDELYDLVQGKDPHPYIIQSFTNPQTKQLDRDRLNQFLHSFDQLTPEIKTQWINLEKAIKEDRINKKYNALIANAFYVPAVIAKRNFINKNQKAVVRLINLPYTEIKDTNVTVTDKEISAAYEEHKKDFEQSEPMRALDFVVFDVLPSDDDLKKAKEDIDNIKIEFEKAGDKEIANFTNSNSDSRYDSTFYPKGKLPLGIDTVVFKAAAPATKVVKSKKASKKQLKPLENTTKSGIIIGPYIDNNTYYLAKLIETQDRPDSMRAKHILLAFQGSERAEQNIKRTKIQAKKSADSILDVLKKNPLLFEDIAKKMSDDPTAKQKGGDLGWFADGTMVYQFNEACLKGKVGDKVLVETMFGYHVIEITGKKDAVKKARVAIIKRAIDPSNKTVQDIYAKASKFTAENPDLNSFESSAVKQGLNKRSADFVREMDNGLPGMEQAREIVRWSFDEKSKVGDVKDFEVDNKYVTAVLKSVKKKGIPKLEEIKKEITAIAKKDKKAEMLIKKFADVKKTASTLEQMAAILKCKVDTAKEVSFSSYSLPAAGNEPAVIGTIFTLKKGSLSSPIKGEKGVFVFNVDDIVEPPQVTDFKNEVMQQASFFKSRVSYEVFNALQKETEITDNRIIYY